MNLPQFLSSYEPIGRLEIGQLYLCRFDPQEPAVKARVAAERPLNRTQQQIVDALRVKPARAPELWKASGVKNRSTFEQEIHQLKKIGMVVTTGIKGRYTYHLGRDGEQ